MFDGKPLKLWAGATGLVRGRGSAVTVAWGSRIQLNPCLDLDISVPWRQASIPGESGEEPVSISGPGDLSISAAFDFLELVNPSLSIRECDITGDVFWKAEDHFRTLKNPHLSVSLSVSLPTGPADLMDADGCELLGPEHQPGSGVMVPTVGLDFSQGLGRLTARMGLTGSFPVGADVTGLRRSAAWSMTAGITLRPRPGVAVWAVDASVGVDWTQSDHVRDGVALAGSSGGEASAKLAGSVGLGRGYSIAIQLSWSFWERRPGALEPFEPGFGAGIHLVVPCQ